MLALKPGPRTSRGRVGSEWVPSNTRNSLAAINCSHKRLSVEKNVLNDSIIGRSHSPPPRPNVSNLGIFKMENFGTPVPIFLNIQKEATCYNSMTENIFGLQKKSGTPTPPKSFLSSYWFQFRNFNTCPSRPQLTKLSQSYEMPVGCR